VLDPPTLPTRRARPKRALIVVAITALAGAAAVLREWWRSGAAAELMARREAQTARERIRVVCRSRCAPRFPRDLDREGDTT
jgi:hypothetical protein